MSTYDLARSDHHLSFSTDINAYGSGTMLPICFEISRFSNCCWWCCAFPSHCEVTVPGRRLPSSLRTYPQCRCPIHFRRIPFQCIDIQFGSSMTSLWLWSDYSWGRGKVLLYCVVKICLFLIRMNGRENSENNQWSVRITHIYCSIQRYILSGYNQRSVLSGISLLPSWLSSQHFSSSNIQAREA